MARLRRRRRRLCGARTGGLKRQDLRGLVSALGGAGDSVVRGWGGRPDSGTVGRFGASRVDHARHTAGNGARHRATDRIGDDALALVEAGLAQELDRDRLAAIVGRRLR